MFRFTEFILKPDSLTNIASPQSVLVATNPTRSLILNSNSGGTDTGVILNFQGFSYDICIYGSESLKDTTFTIIGYQNGVLISATAESTDDPKTLIANKLFDSIVSITCNTDIPVGQTVSAGVKGSSLGVKKSSIVSLPFPIDSPYKKPINCLVTIEETPGLNTGDFVASYTVYGSLKEIKNCGKTIPSMLDHELIQIGTITPTIPFITITAPFRYLVLKIDFPATNLTINPNTILRFSQEG